MQTVDVNHAKQRFPELIERTISGDKVVITHGGQPVARLVAIIKPTRKQRRFGSTRVSSSWRMTSTNNSKI